MFATRAHESLERRVTDVLHEPGRHLVVHGWTGAGKTSLIEHVCDASEVRYLKIECSGDVDELLGHVLNRLGKRETTEYVDERSISAEAGGNVLGLFSGKAKGERGTEEHSAPYAASPESIVVDALISAGIRVLFIDNLEDLSDSAADRRGICRLLKACSSRARDLAAGAPTLALAGPSAVATSLLLEDEAASRRTVEIEVPRMPPSEIEQILIRGQEILQIRFEADCRDLIVAYAGGFPYYAHLYALHCTRRAFRESRETVTGEDFGHALQDIIEACSGRLNETYGRATRSRGEPALRRGVLAALAASDATQMTIAEVQRRFLTLHPQYERIQRVRFVGRLLHELRDDQGIVEDTWLPTGEPAIQFRDPLLRVYVQLRALRDAQAQESAWRASLPP
jgi:hypothetical protein